MKIHPSRVPFISFLFVLVLNITNAIERAPAQTLTVTPTTVDFAVQLGGSAPPTQFLQVTTSPPGLSFTARVKTTIVSNAWLVLGQTGGTSPAMVALDVDMSRIFNTGARQATVEVTLTGSGLTQSATVTLVVGGGGGTNPLLGISPDAMFFQAEVSGSAPPSQMLTVQNLGGGTLSYQLGISYTQGGQTGWLGATPGTGQVSSGSRSHTVSVNPSGLPAGQHTGRIRITGNASNSPRDVAITLTIGGGGGAPGLSLTPDTLEFSATEQGPSPPPQNFAVNNTGTGSVQYSISSNQPWLGVTPPSGSTVGGTVLHSVTVNPLSLPQGLYIGMLHVQPQNSELAAQDVEVRFQIGAPNLISASPARLDFFGNPGSPILRKQLVSILSTPLAGVSWRARVGTPSATWLRLSPAEGKVPAHLVVEVDNQGMPAGEFEGRIDIEPVTPATASGEPVRVSQASVFSIPVRVILVSAPALLAVEPPQIRFTAAQGSPAQTEQVFEITNRGGGALNWISSVETDQGQGWLSVSSTFGTTPARIAAVANPGGLAPGVYHGRVKLQAGAAIQTIPVSMIVSPGGGLLDTGHSGIRFDDLAGGTRLQSSRLRVINRGPGTISWNAEISDIAGGNWLTLGGAAGQSTGPDSTGASELTLNASAAGLVAGVYHALVRINSPDAPNSPRLATVVMNVRPTAGQPAVAIQPAGLTFAAVQAAPAPPAQTIELRSSQVLSPAFRAAASTGNGGNWLTVTPEAGMLSADGRVTFNVAVSPAGLTPGTYRGQVGFTTSDGVVRSAAVTLVVSTVGGGACTPSGLAIVPRAPVQNFQALTGAPVPVEVELIDEACGGTTLGASVLALADVGDEVLVLHPSGAGRYSGAWTPRNAASGANLRFVAKSGAFTASATVMGTITNSGLPVLSRDATVNSASFSRDSSLAPGSIMTSFGLGLSGGIAAAQSVPLPTTLADLSLIAGGRPAPLYFVQPGQVNAQLPVETPAGTTTQVVARSGQRLTSPVEVTVANAGPGIFATPSASGPFRAIAQNQNFSLNTAANPARVGEALIVYFTGVGEVDPLIATGQAAPLNVPSFGTLQAAATIGGQPATVLFSGLAPGFVGLGQANLLIPAGTATGADVPISIRIDGQISNSALAAIAP